jgi:hypothetical protein
MAVVVVPLVGPPKYVLHHVLCHLAHTARRHTACRVLSPKRTRRMTRDPARTRSSGTTITRPAWTAALSRGIPCNAETAILELGHACAHPSIWIATGVCTIPRGRWKLLSLPGKFLVLLCWRLLLLWHMRTLLMLHYNILIWGLLQFELRRLWHAIVECNTKEACPRWRKKKVRRVLVIG